jgi:hypothetical protein
MPEVVWTQRQDIGPQARASHAMAYDTGRQRTVVFGGQLQNGGAAGDTWEWDGGYWTQVSDMGPNARAGHALAYSTSIVLFGGATDDKQYADTWRWDGTVWTQVADTGPTARRGHALAYDAARQRVILFGGEVGNEMGGDTWAWDGAAWTQVQDVGPSGRRGHAMAYDPLRDRVVLFGGDDGETAMRDTWEWDSAAWVSVQDTGPDALTGAAMVFDGAAILLFGGVSAPNAGPPAPVLYRNSWEWPGDFWTERADIGPSARWGTEMALDGDRGRVVLFGGCSKPPSDPGYAGFVLADTWEAPFEVTPVDAGPTLSSFTMDPGSAAPHQLVTFSVVLSKAPNADTPVEISLANALVFSIVVPAGVVLGSVDRPADWPSGSYDFRARLGADSLVAPLTVR